MELGTGDSCVIWASLNTIARSVNMSALARETGLDRSDINETPSEGGNTTLTTLMEMTSALGIRQSL